MRSITAVMLTLAMAAHAAASDLHDAVQRNDTEAIAALLEAGVHPDRRFNGLTPLMMAARGGKTEAIATLLEGEASPRLQTDKGDTALHFAARKGDVEGMTLLIEAYGDPDPTNHDRHTPLHLAAADGNTETIGALVAAGADLEASGKNGSTPLHYAVWNGHTDAVVALLAAGADPLARDARGNTAVDVADRSAERQAPPKGHTEALAALRNHLRSAEELMNAAKGGDLETVAAKLDAGANPDTREESGETLLHAAAANGHAAVVSALLDAGAEPEAKTKTGVTPLYKAAGNAHAGAIEALLAAGADPNETIHGQTPLYLAARAYGEGRAAAIAALLAEGADPNKTTRTVRRAPRPTWQKILERAPEPPPSVRAETPLYWAAERGDGEAVAALLAAGADPNAVAEKGNGPLHNAAERGDVAIIATLLGAGADPNGRTDEKENTALHIAARHGHRTAVQALLDAGADPESKNNAGVSVLSVASVAVIPELLKAGAGARARADTTPDDTALRTAAERGDLETVVIQLNVGANANAQNEKGFTALHYAAEELHGRVVEWLVANGANPTADDNVLGLTPLELIEANIAHGTERAAAVAGVGIFAGAYTMSQLNRYRKSAVPVQAILEQAERKWSWVDTVRQKFGL